MNALHLSIIATALVTAYACVLPGVFIVLRGVALMSDAISHAVLLGIVLMFLYVQNLHSPLLIFGAAAAGLTMVALTEALIHSAYLKKDAAIGLVFPLFFSIAVILINLYTRDVHLDMDMVLLGELAFVPFNRIILWGIDCGPTTLWIMSLIGIVNTLGVYFFYKELQCALFDPLQARLAGYTPVGLYYGLMAMVSITAVGAFDVVGSIVVVALMITPAATAFIITYTLYDMLITSVSIGIVSALLGCSVASWGDISIAGAIAVASGSICALVFMCAPRTGLIARWRTYLGLRKKAFLDILCVYLAKKEALQGSYLLQIQRDLQWQPVYSKQLLAHGKRCGMLIYTDSYVVLTTYGKKYVADLTEHYRMR